MVCKYKGFAGSIRGIAAHSQSPYVASCSIDRFVRLHDLNTKQLLKKVILIYLLHLSFLIIQIVVKKRYI